MAVQISSPKAPAQQQTSSFTASRPRSEVRDKLENFLTSSDKTDRSKTWAAHRASGFSDFFADPEFKEQFDKFSAEASTDESVWSKWPAEQRRAFGEVTDPIVAARLKKHAEDHSRLLAQKDVAYSVQVSTGSYQAYIPPSGIGSSRPFDAKEISRSFEEMANAGIVDHLKAVDRDEKAGISPTKWEAVFRAQVTGLDHHFDLMRRSYQAHKKDTAEITARYEAVLGSLYDYAKARDAGQA